MALRPIYSDRRIDGKQFLLAEHVESYVEAQLAAAEYRCEGLLVRVEPNEKEEVYYIWTRPGRKNLPHTLPSDSVWRGSWKDKLL